jgi:hypothetical protein
VTYAVRTGDRRCSQKPGSALAIWSQRCRRLTWATSLVATVYPATDDGLRGLAGAVGDALNKRIDESIQKQPTHRS